MIYIYTVQNFCIPVGLFQQTLNGMISKIWTTKFMLPLITYESSLSSMCYGLWFRISYNFVRSKNVPTTCWQWSMASLVLSMKVWLAGSIDFLLCFWQNTMLI
jgi:hypothetical protein